MGGAHFTRGRGLGARGSAPGEEAHRGAGSSGEVGDAPHLGRWARGDMAHLGRKGNRGGVLALLAGRRVERELALTSPGVHS